MKLTSPGFTHESTIPAKYTCDGEDINPPLAFHEVPPAAKGLVLIMDDPDAPAGVWDHWIIYDIPSETREIAESQEPPGVPGMNSFRRGEYGGPCPPDKQHRYVFKLYALDTLLRLPAGSGKADVEGAMEGHILEQAQLMGKYKRS